MTLLSIVYSTAINVSSCNISGAVLLLEGWGRGNPIDAHAHMIKSGGMNGQNGHNFHHFSVKIEKCWSKSKVNIPDTQKRCNFPVSASFIIIIIIKWNFDKK